MNKKQKKILVILGCIVAVAVIAGCMLIAGLRDTDNEKETEEWFYSQKRHFLRTYINLKNKDLIAKLDDLSYGEKDTDYTEELVQKPISDTVYQEEYEEFHYNGAVYDLWGIRRSKKDIGEKLGNIEGDETAEIYKINGISEKYCVALKLDNMANYAIYTMYQWKEENVEEFTYPENAGELFDAIGINEDYADKIRIYAVVDMGEKKEVIHYYIDNPMEFIDKLTDGGSVELQTDSLVADIGNDKTLEIQIYSPMIESYIKVSFAGYNPGEPDETGRMHINLMNGNDSYRFMTSEEDVVEIFNYIISNYEAVKISTDNLGYSGEPATSEEEYLQQYIDALTDDDIEEAKKYAYEYYKGMAWIEEVVDITLCTDNLNGYRTGRTMAPDDVKPPKPGELVLFYVDVIRDGWEHTRIITLMKMPDGTWEVLNEGL